MAGFVEATPDEIRSAWLERWGGLVVTPYRQYVPADVRGAATHDAAGRLAALVTWHLDGDEAELVTLDAWRPGSGLGRAALDHVEGRLRSRGIRRVRLFTTNDNLRAQQIYLRRGYRVVRVYLDSMERVRAVKPALGHTGEGGLPLRDMWELEKEL